MTDLLFCIFVLAILALVCLYGVKIERISSEEMYLNRLNHMRGLFAIEIVVGHVIRYEKTILYPLGKFMIISVAFFFFISAWGMVTVAKKRENYFSGFLCAKPLYLLGLAIIIFVFNVMVDYICPMELGYWNKESSIGKLFFFATNWYLWELIIFYICFYCIYKYVTKYRALLMTVITLGMAIGFFIAGFPESWYASALAFPLGILFGEYFSSIKKVLDSIKGVLFTVLLSISGLSCLVYTANNLLDMVVLRNAMCIAALFVVYYIVTFYQLGNNRLSKFLCQYSTEIYLSQFIWLAFTSSYEWDYKVRLLFVIVSTLLTALVLHPICVALKKLLKKLVTA